MKPVLWERWEGSIKGGRKWARKGGRGVFSQRQRAPSYFPGCDVLGAFYSEKLPGTTGRIVVLNTNLYYTSNEQTASMADPAQQFQWLEDVLSNASRAGEMVRAATSSPSPLTLESRPA